MGKKKQTIGYWYWRLLHFGWCRYADAMLEYRGGDRPAWQGRQAANGRIVVNAPELWGGEKQEGGIVGDLDLMLGGEGQEPSNLLTEELGPQPGFLDRVTTAFRGKFGALNPYPKPVAAKWERHYNWPHEEGVWYEEKVRIGMIPTQPLALQFSLDVSGSMNEMTSNGQTRLANMKTAINAVLDLIADVVLPFGVSVDIRMVAWSVSSTSTTIRGVNAANIDTLKSWVNARTAGGITDFRQALSGTATYFDNSAGDAAKILFFVTDGEPNVDGMTPLEVAIAAGDIVAGLSGVRSYGINIDLGITEYTAYVDNTPADGIPVVEGSDPSALTSVIISALGGLYAMNPAHILYYSITSPTMQGEPTSLIADAHWRAQADQLYAEGFGLCAEYLYDTDIENFQQKILDIIGGALTQSRVDGKYYLDLIRPNYDFESLPIVHESDVLEFEREPSNPAEAVNEVLVEWFDPELKQERTTTPVHALGNIQATGQVRSETFVHREIPTESLALRVAKRNLGSKATPLSRFRLTTNRNPWKLRPGLPFRLQMPSQGIADMVCWAGGMDFGLLTAGAIKMASVQDVFSMPDSVYVSTNPGLFVPPDNTPQPPIAQVAFEAPYVELAGTLGAADLAALGETAGFLATAAVRPNAAAQNYSLYTAATGEEFADRGAADFCPSALVVEAAPLEGPLATEFTLIDGVDLDLVEVGTAALWDDEICRIDALDTTVAPVTISLGRSCADTVPQEHAAGSRIYFYDAFAGSDQREYVEGETVQAKMLTRTAGGQLAVLAAPTSTANMTARQARPYPPADVKINDEYFPSIAFGAIDVDFVDRDRLAQADQLVSFDESAIGPEAGTLYAAEFYLDNVLDHSVADVAAGPIEWVPSHDGQGRLRLWAVRDGFDSTAHDFEFSVGDPLWTPAEITTALWFDASDPATVTLSGGNVSALADKSGNGRNASQGTSSARPALIEAALNGRAVLRLDGADDHLFNHSTLTGLLQATAGAMLFAVRKCAAEPTDNRFLVVIRGGTGGARAGLEVGRTSKKPAVGGRRLDGDSFQTVAAAADVGVAWGIQAGVLDYANSDAFLYINGALDGSTTSFLTSGNTSNTASAGFTIGASPNGTAERFNGDIAEIIVVPGAVNSTVRQKIEGYLAYRWGLQANLPIGHPYKTSPPTI